METTTFGATVHMCPPGRGCEPCGVGPVAWRRMRLCCHCRKSPAGWHENGKRVASRACRWCYETVQAQYLDRQCLTDPCTHRVSHGNG